MVRGETAKPNTERQKKQVVEMKSEIILTKKGNESALTLELSGRDGDDKPQSPARRLPVIVA